MGTQNHGLQEITYEYYEEATAEDFNKRFLDILPRGIYKGGYFTKVSDSEITLSTFTAEIGDENEQVSVKTSAVATIKDATLDSGTLDSGHPYIVLRWAFVEQQNNYVEIHAIASVATAQANDIIVGKIIFDGGSIDSFDYTDRTFLNVQDLFFKVETSSGMYVQLRAGKIQDGTQYIVVPEQKVGAFDVPGGSNSRIDLVYIDTDGTVKIKKGTEVVSPVAPNYENKLVVAEVKIVNGDTDIPADRITDVRSFILPLVSVNFGSWVSKSNNTVYFATTDGFVCASGPANTTVSGYTDNSTPPTIRRLLSSSGGFDHPGAITMPVKKGSYWKVTGATVSVWWIPIGA